jgi:cyclopropane-fatty-acyl-phospholipid synthase
MTRAAAVALLDVLEQVLGSPSPVRVRAWDGSEAGPEHGPVLVLNRRRALRRLMWSPDELGLGRAYVSGDLDVEGDLYEALATVLAARRGPGGRPGRLSLLRDVARLGALGPPPPPPPEEARLPRRWRPHSRPRDAAAIRHHYDVGNEFYRLMLGPSMVYSCAYWPDGAADPEDGAGLVAGLDGAQEDKLELVCRKLALRPGMRLLDVGCGWGSMVLHAAREHGVHAVGVTVSQQQADLARDRVAEAGLQDRVEIRLQDYRDVTDGPYDAICSIGMAEHVGRRGMPEYAASLRDLLAPQGRLLHHSIASHRPPDVVPPRGFVEAYVFPDGELLRLNETITVQEDAGLEVRDVHALREHYTLTLRAWVARLEQERERAVALVGEGRVRVWQLYMTASATSFAAGRIGVDQVLVVRGDARPSGLGLRRDF